MSVKLSELSCCKWSKLERADKIAAVVALLSTPVDLYLAVAVMKTLL